MSDTGAIAVRDASSPLAASEMEQRRSEARELELQVARKEAELRRAKEEQSLLKELRTMNEMILKKKERKQEGEAKTGLKISSESLAELRALEDQIKLENKRTSDLQNASDVVSHQMEDIEHALTEKRLQFETVKQATQYEEDSAKMGCGPVVLNEFVAKKRVFTALSDEQKTVKENTDRLTAEIEELTSALERQESLEAKIAEAKEVLAQQEAEYRNALEDVKSYDRIRKKKERMLDSAPTEDDKYKKIRVLDGDKRVLHNNLAKLRESNVSNSKSVLSLEVRLRQLETRLEAVNLFLKQVFAEVEDDEVMDGISEDAKEVSLAQFEQLCHDLEVSRDTVLQRDTQLDDHDVQVEKLEQKVSILQNAIASRSVSSQLQVREKEKEFSTLVAHVDEMRCDFEDEVKELSAENERLRKQIQQL